MFRLAVLGSGTGSNYQAIQDAVGRGEIPAQVVGVFCNVAGAGILARAEAAGVPARLIPSRGIAAPEARQRYDAELAERIADLEVDLVVLAGWMRLLSAEFVARFSGRLVNIHPSLLPAFPGLRVHESVLAYGCKVSGCTVHFVSEEMDAGPIIAQACVPVFHSDTPESLANRVHGAEHKLYPWVVRQIALGAVRLRGRVVEVDAELPPFCVPAS